MSINGQACCLLFMLVLNPGGSVICVPFQQVKKAGKFMETKRTEGISTSDIILRIIWNYSIFGLRDLGRGHSRKELGLSLVRLGFVFLNHKNQDSLPQVVAS